MKKVTVLAIALVCSCIFLVFVVMAYYEKSVLVAESDKKIKRLELELKKCNGK
jgi:hypothetical protein